jgi:hypothetical protein
LGLGLRSLRGRLPYRHQRGARTAGASSTTRRRTSSRSRTSPLRLSLHRIDAVLRHILLRICLSNMTQLARLGRHKTALGRRKSPSPATSPSVCQSPPGGSFSHTWDTTGFPLGIRSYQRGGQRNSTALCAAGPRLHHELALVCTLWDSIARLCPRPPQEVALRCARRCPCLPYELGAARIPEIAARGCVCGSLRGCDASTLRSDAALCAAVSASTSRIGAALCTAVSVSTSRIDAAFARLCPCLPHELAPRFARLCPCLPHELAPHVFETTLKPASWLRITKSVSRGGVAGEAASGALRSARLCPCLPLNWRYAFLL